MVYGSLILIGLVVGGVFVLWNLGVFNVGGGGRYMGGDIATGFDRIKLPDSFSYRNQSFIVSFTSPFGTAIMIKNVSLYEYIADENCSFEPPDSPYPVQYISAGSAFNVSATCPTKEDGEAYDLRISIQYTVLDGGKELRYTDTGRIRGQGEPYRDY